MKENSIEEDIIKKFEKFCENLYVFKDDDMGGHFEKIVGNQRANTTLGYLVFKENLEEKLSDYKRVLKENEELKEIYKSEKKMKNEYVKLYQDLLLKENVIPVQKVKDKIEELQNGPLKINENNKYYYETEAYNKIIIQVLQKLLEGRK
nr:MAG TPA: hypothetical protein [Caudoviricetes sp.]